ncbi:hypothetical protein K7432_011097 [Basidiobolus ranarum]|uniref:Carrier domain-containing protein n=1 Tax=Basidiobolus ranarum TaxID=34480 RepID=A0ABR2WMU6_9FUNG
MMLEVEASVILTSKELAVDLDGNLGTNVEIITLEEVEMAQQPDNDPLVDISPNNLAYVLYTSGTTGLPKGAMIEHRNVVQFFAAAHRLLTWNPSSRFLQNASFIFDVSIFEMFFSWSVGITLIAASQGILLGNLELLINTLQITHIAMTPTMASMIRRSRVPTVEAFIAGGEMLTQQVIEEWGGENSLFNAYGPTEVTIGCSFLCNVYKGVKPSNIGNIMDSCSCYVLSQKMEILPRGSVGELCVGGSQVARGYLKRPELTAEKFIKIPAISERIYRTGDLVKIHHDGAIEILGRIDDQVKLNGLRIELGEINAVMAKSNDLISGVVTYVLRNQWQSRDQLVSFVACAIDDQSDSLVLFSEGSEAVAAKSIVKSALDEATKKLPLYMVPSLVLPINRLPRGSTNKTDRKVLEQLYNSLSLEMIQQISLTEDEEADEASMSELEVSIRDILAEVGELPPSKVKSTTSIFHLGLDSISAIRVSSRLRSIGLNLNVAEILQQLNVKNMARLLNERENSLQEYAPTGSFEKGIKHLSNQFIESIPELLSVSNNSIEAILPCSPSQIFTISSWQNTNKTNFVSYFAFASSEKLSSSQLQASWLELLKKNSILRTAFIPTLDFKMPFVQVVLEQPVPQWTSEVVDQEQNLACIQNSVVNLASAPVYLSQPPIAAHCIEFVNSTVLVVGMHHALYDGWSLPLMMSELERNYNGIDPSSDSPNFTRFLDYVFAQDNDTQRQYWRSYLEDSKPLMFPPMNVANAGKARTFVIATDALDNIPQYEDICRENQTTLQAVFLAAWAKLQCTELNSEDSLFGLYHSGRSIPVEDVGSLMAPCINMLPLYVKNANTMDVIDLSRRIQEDLARQIPFQQAFIHDIQNTIGLGCDPLFNTYVNYLKFPAESKVPALFEVLDLLSYSDRIKSVQEAAYSDNNQNLPNPAATSIRSDLDIEIAVRGDQACVGIFCPPHILSEAQAIEMIQKLCNIVRDSLSV